MSEKTKHTPGPWIVETSGKLPIHVGAMDRRWRDQSGIIIAAVNPKPMIGTGDFQESLANARLIAAAPELLDAVRLTLAGLRNGSVKAKPIIGMNPDAEEPTMEDLADILGAALAKAGVS